MKRKSIIHRLQFCTLIFMSFFLVGCPVPKIIKTVGGLGPEYPKKQIAIVKGSTHDFAFPFAGSTSSTAKIAAVDDWHYYADEVRIPPGPHEVLVIIEKSTIMVAEGDLGLVKRGARVLSFKFDAEAGHTYKVDIPLYWRKNSIIKIIDKATKEIVGSQVVN